MANWMEAIRAAAARERSPQQSSDPVLAGYGLSAPPQVGMQVEEEAGPDWAGGVAPVSGYSQRVGTRSKTPDGRAGNQILSPGMPGPGADRNDSLFGGAMSVRTVNGGYTASGMQQAAMSMDPAGRSELIQWLINAGLLDEDLVVSRTAITPAVMDAWMQVGGLANGDNVNLAQAMGSFENWAQEQGIGEHDAGYRVPPLLVELKDPEYLRSTFKEASYMMLGQHLPPDVIEKQVEAYQGADRSYQIEMHRLQNQDPEGMDTAPGAPINVIDAPTAPQNEADFIEDAVWDIDPEGVEARGYLDTANHFFQSLRGLGNTTRRYVQ